MAGTGAGELRRAWSSTARSWRCLGGTGAPCALGMGGASADRRRPIPSRSLQTRLAVRGGPPAARGCAGRPRGGRTPFRDRRGDGRKATPFYSHPTSTDGRAKSPDASPSCCGSRPSPARRPRNRRGVARSVAAHGRRHVGRRHHLNGANLVPRLWQQQRQSDTTQGERLAMVAPSNSRATRVHTSASAHARCWGAVLAQPPQSTLSPTPLLPTTLTVLGWSSTPTDAASPPPPPPSRAATPTVIPPANVPSCCTPRGRHCKWESRRSCSSGTAPPWRPSPACRSSPCPFPLLR